MKVRPVHGKDGSVFRWCADAGMVSGKRIKRRFDTKEEAERWAKANKTIQRKEGSRTFGLWTDLTEGEKGSLVRALEVLRPALTRINFEEMARHYLTFIRPAGDTQTLEAAISLLIAQKERANKKESYCVRLKRDLLDFAKDHPGKKLHEVSQKMIEDSVFKDDWKPVTQRNRLRDIHQLLAFGVKKKWCPENPAAEIEKPTVDFDTPSIFTPEEAEWILRAAEERSDLGMVPFLVLGLFAGIRTGEIFGMGWENVKWDRKLIELGAHQTKTRARRIVDRLPENLLAWLLPYRGQTGKVAAKETTMEWRLPLLAKEIQKIHPSFRWKRNAMRHSSVSYHMALHQDETRTALVHGHRPDILFRHYRELVSREEAEKYYAVFPAKC